MFTRLQGPHHLCPQFQTPTGPLSASHQFEMTRSPNEQSSSGPLISVMILKIAICTNKCIKSNSRFSAVSPLFFFARRLLPAHPRSTPLQKREVTGLFRIHTMALRGPSLSSIGGGARKVAVQATHGAKRSVGASLSSGVLERI